MDAAFDPQKYNTATTMKDYAKKLKLSSDVSVTENYDNPLHKASTGIPNMPQIQTQTFTVQLSGEQLSDFLSQQRQKSNQNLNRQLKFI